ncbi:MAG: late competence development ComFB family protein, partial [Symploca sp. SIO1C4]|nr:late competence development ComFB family protein [Symploca sp. SIO1C4]
FINVMEELVLTEAITQVADIEAKSDSILDVGDIAAYALNRLPPLYATSEEGAKYQRQRAEQQLHELIRQQVTAAISRNLDRPDFGSQRQGISKNTQQDILEQISRLLQDYQQTMGKGNSRG